MVMKRVLRFFSGMLTHGVIIHRMIGRGIMVYCDADWGGDTIDRKSRMGFLIYVGGTLISWLSWKQATVACSSTEAEYRVIATTTQELEAIRSMLLELGV